MKMSKFTPKQITLDLAEWIEVQTELDSLRRPATGEELSEAEHQEATGILLLRALQNPNLFRVAGVVDLGKYTATVLSTIGNSPGSAEPVLKVKFVRT